MLFVLLYPQPFCGVFGFPFPFHITSNISQLQMPVKCPLARIIKHRRAQGRDCYEVSWENLDGIETSIVPSELVQRY
jgi:hypothetical protein